MLVFFVLFSYVLKMSVVHCILRTYTNWYHLCVSDDIPESLKPKENETLYELKDPDSSGEGGEDENGNDFLFNNDTDIWPLPEESTDSTPSYIMTTTVSTPVPHDHQHDRFPLSVGFCVTGLLLVIAVVITYTM